jgi:hypothetical protein
MLQIFKSLARWTPVGMGSYFTISLLSTSQWTQAAIATCTTLGWLSITYTNWTESRWMQDVVETVIEWSSDAFKTLITFFWRASIGLFFATLFAMMGILIGSIFEGALGMILQVASIPFSTPPDPASTLDEMENWYGMGPLMIGPIRIGVLLGSIIGFFKGLLKPWESPWY